MVYRLTILAVLLFAGTCPPLVADVDVLHKRQARLQDAWKMVRASVVAITDGMGSGTGVVVSPDGIILTASHVVESSAPGRRRRRDIEAIFPDGRTVRCRLLGRNRYCDAAVLRIESPRPPDGFPYSEMGSSKDVQRGEWCFAMGHPGARRDDRPAVVRFGRVLSVSDHTLVSDNAIVLGDSGGPLFNLQGRVIGIHSMITRIIVENRHVAIDVFHRDWDRLLDGDVWGRLQINEEDVASTEFIGMRLRWKDYRARVAAILPDSPADRAGIRTGDQLLRVSGYTFADRLGLTSLFSRLDEHEEVELQVLRDGERESLQLVTGRLPEADDDETVSEEEEEFYRDFQQQIGFNRRIGPNEKRAAEVLRNYHDITEPTTGGVVCFLDGGRQFAMGVVMSSDGDIITKATELDQAVEPVCVLPDGTQHVFEQIGTDVTWDLALIRVNTSGLRSMQWRERDMEMTQLLITPDQDGRPMLPGVVGVPDVRLKTASQGFLGVRLGPRSRYGGVRVESLVKGGAALRDGIRAGDIILAIDSDRVANQSELIRRVKSIKPNQRVNVRVRRGNSERIIKVTLTPRFVTDDNDVHLSHYRASRTRGKFASLRNSGFPEVFQHDTDLFPHQCGGPVLDLSGRAVGINIARAARVISYAIPAKIVRRVYDELRTEASEELVPIPAAPIVAQ